MQAFAQAWLVLEISGDRASLPLTIAIQTLPLLIFGTWGGSVADRFDNRRLLVATSIVNAVLAVVLGFIARADSATVGAVYVIGALTGFVTVIERPATQAFLSEIVPPSEITSAVGLNAMVFPVARLAGPPLSSLAIAGLGLAWCFFLNAASFGVIIVGLLAMRRADMFERVRRPSRHGMVADGLRYARRDRVVRHALVVMFFVGLAGFNFMAVMPMMAKYTFGLSDRGLVLPMALSAIGSLAAGAFAASVARPTLWTLAVSATGFGALLVAYGAAPTTLWWTVLSLPVGVAATLFTTFVASVLQRTARPDMLGRVMALNSIALLGTTPIGMLLVAWTSSALDPRAPFILGGAAVVVTGLASWALVRSTREALVAPTS